MFKEVADKFAPTDQLPVEITEVRDTLITLGYQDEIIFSPEDTDPGKLKGLIYRYTYHKGVYAPPTLVSLIIYSKNVSLEWQRMICCKELVHICEGALESTNTQDEIEGLLTKLLGPLSTEDYGMADFMAAVDRLALYQSLAVLFPDAAREQALKLMDAPGMTIEKVAKWAVIPVQLAAMVLSKDWLELKKHLLDC